MTEPRNILFFLTDQQRADTLGCYGNAQIDTPAVDSLATEGTVFDRCFTPTAICTPARTSLLTGVRPFRHRLLANYERNVGYIETLSESVVPLMPFSLRLRDAGYNVGLAGKWHVGRHLPAEFGFDGTHFPGWHNPVHHPRYVEWLARRGLSLSDVHEPLRGTFPNGRPGNLMAGRLDLPADATFEAFIAEETIGRLRRYATERRQRGRPFFLAVHFFGPHLPTLLPAAQLERYSPDLITLPASAAETFAGKPPVQRRYSEHWAYDTFSPAQRRWLIAAYWGYVTHIDTQIGRVLAELRELGLWDETAVVFTADHGGFAGAHRLFDKGPAMYDDIYRIPAVLRVPGLAGHREGRLASLLDFTATILDLAGIGADPEADGTSLLPLARDDRELTWRDAITAEFHGHHFPYPQRMLRTATMKLVVNPESVNELYDLERDPAELTNVYEEPAYTAVRDGLLHRLYEDLRARGDNFHHWMATMYPVGGEDYDTSLSDFEISGQQVRDTPA